MLIGLPTGASHTPAVTTTSFPHVWPLTTSLTPPTTVVNKGTCTWSSPTLKCSFATALTKNTAYGLAMPGSGAVVGSWAPITISTRMNNLATAGPVMDTNRVFDSINTDAAAAAMTLAQAKITASGATAKEFPGETAEVEWTFTMSAWAATKVIKAPYNIVITLGKGGSRVQDTTSTTWIKYPVTYDDWTWVTTCTNTQFGIDDADTSDKIPAVTMKTTAPKCSVVNNALVIPVDQDLTSTDFSTFKMKFKISVKMPTNKIGTGTTVDAYLADPASNNVYAVATQLTGFLPVTKPSGQADTQATGLVSFGKNPNDATEITRGVGVYSTPYCMIATTANSGFGDDYFSNCGVSSVIDAATVASVGTKVLEVVNAIEVAWALPYEIPNDRTYADIVCQTQQVSGSNNAATRYSKDPLRVFQSSVMAAGFGTGNCFYMGVKDSANDQGKHRFQCRNTGKLAKSANLQLAFQYTLSSIGKVYVTANDASVATNAIVQLIALTLICELKVSTYTSATSSAVLWYQSKLTVNIDGNTQANKNGKWQSFYVTHATSPSMGQKTTNQDYYLSKTGVASDFWIILSNKDKVGTRANGKREFPFDTSGTTLDLMINGYGSGLKTTATFTATIPAHGKFTVDTVNKLQTTSEFALLTTYTAKAGESGQATGMVSFKYLKTTWGGTCCKVAGCTDETSIQKCNFDTGSANLLKLFATNSDKQIAHSWLNSKSTAKLYNA